MKIDNSNVESDKRYALLCDTIKRVAKKHKLVVSQCRDFGFWYLTSSSLYLWTPFVCDLTSIIGSDFHYFGVYHRQHAECMKEMAMEIEKITNKECDVVNHIGDKKEI